MKNIIYYAPILFLLGLAMFSVAYAAPILDTSANITPDTAYTHQTLNCTGSFSDPINATAYANISFYNSTTSISNETNILVTNDTNFYASYGVLSGNTSKNDVSWSCNISVFNHTDGEYDNTSSDLVTITNSIPTAPSVQVITPPELTSGDTATCSWTAGSDNDTSDTINYFTIWYKNGVKYTEEGTTSTSETYDPPSAGFWKCGILSSDLTGNTSRVNTSQITVNARSSSSGTSSGGAVAPSTRKEDETFTKKWATFLATQTNKAEINIENLGIDGVSIDVENSANNVEITIVKRTSVTVDVAKKLSGKSVYQYIDITKSNLEDENIERATIDFKIEKSWITNNNIDEGTVQLLRLKDGEWQELTTGRISADTKYVYYNAITPGFSTFVIVGDTVAGASGEAKEGVPLWLWIVITIIVILIIAGIVKFLASRR